MDIQTENSAQTSNYLADAISKDLKIEDNCKANLDVINLHPDERDKNVGNVSEVDEADEVIVFSTASSYDSSKSKQIIAQDKLLNNEETQPSRAPRLMFMGPTKKNRRARGSRINKNENANHRGNTTTQNVAFPADNNAKDLRDWATKNVPTKPSTNVDKFNNNENSKKVTTPKRMRSTHNSPQSENTSQNAPKKLKTFASTVAENLKLVIVNENGSINETQLGIIESIMMNELDGYLTTSPESVPTFHTTSFHNGVLKLICADEFSAQWITKLIACMPPPWEGAALQIDVCKPPNTNPMVNFRPPMNNVRIRRPTIRFFIPDGMKRPSFEEIIKKFKLQNYPLTTDGWIAWRAEDKGHGIFYYVSVEPTDIEFIKDKESRLFYYFSKIKINLPREPKEPKRENSVGGNNQNVSNEGKQ